MLVELKIKTTIIEGNKNFISGISNVYGLGVYSKFEILKRLGFNPNLNILIKKLTSFHERIFFFSIKNFKIGRDLLRFLFFKISNLIELKTNIGIRHRRLLPIFGRARTNGKTCKIVSQTMFKKFKKLL